MPERLPVVGGDEDSWGTVLNGYLGVGHNADGTNKFTSTTVTNALGYTPLNKAGDTIGSGDAVAMYNTTTAQLLRIVKGTAGSPDAVAGPLLKLERTLQIAHTSFTGDGVEPCATIVGIGTGTTTNDGQVVGVAGLAKSASTTTSSTGGDDACGLYGVGRITGSGTGVGIGAFLNGRRDTNTGLANGAEVTSDNNTATAGSYNTTGFSDTTGLWIRPAGLADSGVGISFGNPVGMQFKVGIGFPAHVNGGKTGGAADYSFRDDANATTSIAINGTHTTALAVASGAGKVLYGRTSDGGIAADVIVSGTNTGRAALQVQPVSSSQAVSVFMVASDTSTEWFSIGATGNMRLIDKNMVLGTSTGTIFGTASNQKQGWWGHSPVVQPSSITVTNYTAASRSFNRSSYTMDQLADFVCEIFTTILKGTGFHA